LENKKGTDYMTEHEYNISSNIAKLIAYFKADYDYIQLDFISKKKEKSSIQRVFFMDKQGELLNGKKTEVKE
jgi:hypothetical protein